MWKLVKMFEAVLYCVVMSILWQNVRANQNLVIQRGIYDRITFPGCHNATFKCNKLIARSENANGTCTCQCKIKYLAYRDPFLAPKNGGYYYNESKKGCVWYAWYTEGCYALESVKNLTHGNITFSEPIIIDLAGSRNIELRSVSRHKKFDGCNITAYIREPGFQRNQWEKVNGVVFELDYENKSGVFGNDLQHIYKLKWNLSDTHAYQGLVMKLDLNGCSKGNTGCIMTKTAGNFSRITTSQTTSSPLVSTTKSRTSSAIDTIFTTQPDRTHHSSPKPPSSLVPTTTQVPGGHTVVTAPDDGGNGDNSWLDLGYIAIICVFLLFVVVVVFFVCFYRRKVGKRNPKGDLSDKEFEEASFAATQSGTSLRSQRLRNLDNGDSTEMMEQGDIEGCLDADAGPSNEWPKNEPEDPAEIQVYTAPEANYSLIVKPIIHRVTSDNNPLRSAEDKASISSPGQVYAVLEDKHDATSVNSAQQTDDDRVFVELNPLYGTVEFPNGKDEPRSDDQAMGINEDP